MGYDKPHERRPRAVLNRTTASLSMAREVEAPNAPPADRGTDALSRPSPGRYHLVVFPICELCQRPDHRERTEIQFYISANFET